MFSRKDSEWVWKGFLMTITGFIYTQILEPTIKYLSQFLFKETEALAAEHFPEIMGILEEWNIHWAIDNHQQQQQQQQLRMEIRTPQPRWISLWYDYQDMQ